MKKPEPPPPIRVTEGCAGLVLFIITLLLMSCALAHAAPPLPTHGDATEHVIQHGLLLSATLFPEDLIVEVEMEYINTPCACECGDVWADCMCIIE